MNIFKRITGAVLTAAVGLSLAPNDILGQTAHAEGADSLSYPVQEFRFGIGDTDRSIIISGTDSGDYLSSYTFLGERSQKWYLNYVSKDVYEIVNSQTGYVVTNDNGLAVIAPDTDSADQRWKIESVQKDFEGYDLYYKITSNSDSSAALTFDPDSNSLSVDTYTGNMYQKYKLNLDGLEGFAGNCLVNGKEKAGTIGGLLGETVFVKNTSELVSALDSTDPKTVVITADIDLVNQNKTQQRIRDNKTIIGSYSKNTVYDSQLRNDDFYGKDDKPSGNIVIQNVNWVARTLNNTGSGVILLQFYGVRNLWLDHNNFSATFGQNRDVEVGKFVWINTPSTSWSDAKYNGYNPDYITASYNYFKNRYWTFAFGSQNKDTSRLHTTLMYNKWEQCSRRCPQYSNGYDHNYNNYHTVTGSSNPDKSSQVIGGEGSRIQNENCRFEGYTDNEVDPDRNSAISCYESGSYTAKSPSDTPTALKSNPLGSAWKPSDCYGYELVEAYNTNGTDIKSFCNAYSGCFKKYGDIKYITDSDCEQFISKKYEQPFLKSVNVGN
ncbi:MAG: RICIN domain-containing protein, partial [Ruminococcus sp.]|nr:RICIN domain-containing protein [Ruminococcus sp.]